MKNRTIANYFRAERSTMKNATFTVTDPETNEIIQQYELQWKTLQGLQDDFLEARQVWSESIVTVNTDTFELSTSDTWRNEFNAANS